MVPKPIGEALIQATIRLEEYGNVRVDKIIKIEMFMSTLIASLPDSIVEIDIASPWVKWGIKAVNSFFWLSL